MPIFATAVFATALAAVALEWAHRTKVALAGAALLVTVGVLSYEDAVGAVDWETIGLLMGMMILVSLNEQTGVFSYVALKVAQRAGTSPLRLVFLLAGLTGVLSAFLDNLTAILLVVPLTLLVADLLGVTAVPLVLIEIFASNIGGTATLIGDPPNIMIGSHVAELGFIDFIVALAPVSAFVLVVTVGALYLLYRGSLQIEPSRAAALGNLDPAADMRQARHVKRSVAVLLGTIVAFFLHAPLHLDPATVALTGATVLLLIATDNVEEALARIQWSTLFFFAGLFVMVGALEHHGVIAHVATAIGGVTDGSRTAEALVVLWSAAAGSAFVDNIPFTAAMIPVVDELQVGGFDDASWWALALGACYGGNATIIAAAANVAASSVLERTDSRISFLRFAAVGIPVTLFSLLVATVYLILFQL